MTARELVERKMRSGLTDLQALVLLVLAEREMMTLTDLAGELRRAVPSVSMAASVMEGREFVVKDRGTGQRVNEFVYFYLSVEGRKRVAWLLGKG